MEELVRVKPTSGGSFNPLSMYPIGSIYRSVKSTDPSELFGGTWQMLKDVFLMAAGDSYPAGSKGGEAEHVLTVEEMPIHDHSLESITGTDDMNFINGSGSFLLQNSDTTMGWPSAKNAKMMYGNTGSTGGSQPHNNLPPYLAVYTWVRTA